MYTFRGILKGQYYGIEKLNTYEVIPFFTFNRYNVFLGWDLNKNQTSQTKFVEDDVANYIVGVWISAALKRMPAIPKCRNFIPEAVINEYDYLSFCNSAWNSFKQQFHAAFNDIQMKLPERYRTEPQLIVQSYGEKEMIIGDQVSTVAGDLSKLFSLTNVKYFWLTPALNVSVDNHCAFWRRDWITNQLELSPSKEPEFFNQLGSHQLTNASWFHDVPLFMKSTVHDQFSLYKVTKIQVYSESIYCYDKILAKDVDLNYGTPLTTTCVFQALKDIDYIDSKKTNFQISKLKERLQKQKDWEKYQLICNTLEQQTYGARFEMTLFYTGDLIVDWDLIDINFKDIRTTFQNYIGKKIVSLKDSPVWFFSSTLIADYMRSIGSEINSWLSFFHQKMSNDINCITVPQLKLIHLLERMLTWLWRGDLKRLAYQTCKEINFVDKLAVYNHPFIFQNVSNPEKLLHDGCKVMSETNCAYWKSVEALLPKDDSNHFTITIKQMLQWQLQFARTCSRKSSCVNQFATTLFNFWFNQVKLCIWKNTQLFKEICSTLNFTAEEKTQAREHFNELFDLINQKLVCNSCFEKGSFQLLCSQSSKLKIIGALSIHEVISQIWSMSYDKIAKFILDQAISTVTKIFNLDVNEFKNSVNEILQNKFKHNKIGVFYTIQSIGFINPFVWTSINYHRNSSSSEISDLEISSASSSDERRSFREFDHARDLLVKRVQNSPILQGRKPTIELVKWNSQQNKNFDNYVQSDKSRNSISLREQMIFDINHNITNHCEGKYDNVMRDALILSFDNLSQVQKLLLTTVCKLPSESYSLKHKVVLYELVTYYLMNAPKKLISQARKTYSLNMTNTTIVNALGEKFFNVKREQKKNNTTKESVPKISITPKHPKEILESFQNSAEKSHRSKLQKASPASLNIQQILRTYESNEKQTELSTKKRKRSVMEVDDEEISNR